MGPDPNCPRLALRAGAQARGINAGTLTLDMMGPGPSRPRSLCVPRTFSRIRSARFVTGCARELSAVAHATAEP